MSGLAGILLGQGFKVSGSDQKFNPACEHLVKMGASISVGHAAEHLPASSSLLVYSSAVDMSNPEVQEAQRRGIPVIRRAEVLAELMRLKFGVAVAGSHGKTTTTSMIAAIMEKGALDPTVIIGGIVKSFGTGARLGKSAYLVAESDESDRSFLLLKPTVAVVTNIDAEHLAAYSSIDDLEQSFAHFVGSVPFYGLAVLCIDDPRVRVLSSKFQHRKMTYGFSEDAQIQAKNLRHKRNNSEFELCIRGKSHGLIDLALPGKHLVLNSLAAIAVGLEFGIDLEVIKAALTEFKGVGRRLEILSEKRDITVIDDYAHHPTEVKATLQAVRDGWNWDNKKLHVVFQPHRYTRTRDCFVDFLSAFDSADNVVISEVYAAGEPPIEGISGESLCSAIQHPSVRYVQKLDDVMDGLVRNLSEGDVVLCMGAGSITNFAHSLAKEMQAR